MAHLQSAFISYAFVDGSSDPNALDVFVLKRGVTAFLAKHDSGDDCDKPSRVSDAIIQNQAVIFVISGASCVSAWGGFELSQARSLNKPVFAYSSSPQLQLEETNPLVVGR